MKKEIQTIIPKIKDIELDSFVDKIRNLILNDIDDTKKVIFLCGKDKSDKNSYRAKVASFLQKEKSYQLAYPEDLFEDLLEGQGGNSLLALEQQLAEAVDLIVLIPESPGSFAELGAFSMKTELARKMLILRLSKFKSGKSFINHGPIRLVKSSKGQVLDIPNDFNEKDVIHTTLVLEKIKNMFPTKRKKKNIDNLLLFPNHILLLIYLFDKLTLASIYKVTEKIMNRKFDNKDNLACKAAIHSLNRSAFIDSKNEFYSITELGYKNITKIYYSMSEISNLRVKIMNKQLSGQ